MNHKPKCETIELNGRIRKQIAKLKNEHEFWLDTQQRRYIEDKLTLGNVQFISH